MKSGALLLIGDRAAYWHQRGRAEAEAALACDDPRLAAIHVELATRCLKMAREEVQTPELEARQDRRWREPLPFTGGNR